MRVKIGIGRSTFVLSLMSALWFIVGWFDGRLWPPNLINNALDSFSRREQLAVEDPRPLATRLANATLLFWSEKKRSPTLTEALEFEAVPTGFDVKFCQELSNKVQLAFQVVVEVNGPNAVRVLGTSSGSYFPDNVTFGNAARLGDYISVDRILFTNDESLSLWHERLGNIDSYSTRETGGRRVIVTDAGSFYLSFGDVWIDLMRKEPAVEAEFCLRGVQSGNRGIWRVLAKKSGE